MGHLFTTILMRQYRVYALERARKRMTRAISADATAPSDTRCQTARVRSVALFFPLVLLLIAATTVATTRSTTRWTIAPFIGVTLSAEQLWQPYVPDESPAQQSL